MKTIFFSGLAGGSGKTTMAINFARYLHYYEKSKVMLLSCDMPSVLPLLAAQAPFPFAARDISPSRCAAYLQAIAAGAQAPAYMIVDLPSGATPEILRLLPVAHHHVMPFEYSMVHYGKLQTFLHLLDKWAPYSIPLLLPNKVSRANATIKSLFDNWFMQSSLSVLPLVTTSSAYAVPSTAPFNPQEFQNMRPFFNRLMHIL